MLIDADDRHVLEPCRVLDQHSFPLGQHGTVRGVPGDSGTGRDPADGEMPDDDPGQRPPQPAARDLRLWRGGFPGVLPPRSPAPGAQVAAHPHEQCRWPPPQRFVSEAPNDGVQWHALTATVVAPLVTLDDAAFEHSMTVVEVLSDGSKATSSSSRQKVVRSGFVKVVWGMSRSS